MLRRGLVLCTAAAAIGVLVAGCGGGSSNSSSSSGSGEGGGAEKVKVVFVGPLANEPIAIALKGAQKYADAHNAEVVGLDSGFEPSKQENAVQDAVSSGQYSALITSPFDPTGGNLRSASEAEMPVVTLFTNIGPDPNATKPQEPWVVAQIYTPWNTLGEHYGEAVAEVCEGIEPCKVAFVPGQGIGPELEALDAMKKVFSKHSNISLSVTKPGLYEAPETEAIVSDLLQASPDTNVVATNGDQMAVGAVPAVEKASLKDQVKVFGVGASQVGIEEVRAGNMYGTVVNNSLPEEQGELTAEMALQAARGEKIPNTGVVPEYPGIPPVLTQANESQWKNWESGWEG